MGHGFYPAPGGIPWMRVPANQPLSNVDLANDGQIDPAGLYSWPFPPWPNAVIEGTSYGGAGPDHHILILESSTNNITGPQTGACTLYETDTNTNVPSMYDAGTNTWSLSAGLHYDLSSNEIAASTGTLDNGAQDSAGVPVVPLLLRYSDVPLGAQHPLRITFPSPTNWYVWPGTGCCTGSGPPQGLLYRLQASVNWQATCPVSSNPQAATILQALQQYGAYMSDHGATGYIWGVPDVRWNDNDLACIKNFSVSDLEVVDNSALQVSAVSGQTKPYVGPATLPLFVVGTAYIGATISAVGGNPATRQLAISSGAMPPGLSLDPVAGTIGGTPTSSAGNPYIFGITATDTASGYSSQEQQFILELAVLPVPDLTVVVSHTGNFAHGQTGAMYSISVANAGTGPAAGTVTVVDTLPSGMTATAMSGAGWNCTLATLTCSRSDVLAAGGAYPLSLTVNIDYTPPFLVTDIATVSGGGEVNLANDQSSDLTLVFQYQAQTITFGMLSNQPLGALPFTVSATASSGLTVSFNSLTTPVCTVSVSGTVTLLSGGTCTIQATQAGGGNFTAAPPVNQSFTVSPEGQTITFLTLPGQVYGTAPFPVSASTTSGLTVSFNSLTTPVCTVTVSGTVTLVSGGTCTIQATQAGGGNFTAAPPVNQSFTVSPASQTITFGGLPSQVYGTAPFPVSATATSTLTVSFNSLTTSVCTVSVSGSTVTLAAIGTCTVQATQAGSASYSPAPSVAQSFTVTAGLATPGTVSLSFANTIVGKSSATQTVTLQNSGNAALTITSIVPAGADAANYRYAADPVHPCPISPATLGAGATCILDVAFVPVSQGTHNNAQIVIADNSGNAAGATQTVSLTGTGIVLSSIAVSATSASLAYNNTEQFIATGTYSDNSTTDLTSQVAWSSSAPAVAAIGAGGLATAVSAGQTTITATQGSVTSNSFQLTVVPGTAAGISVVSGSGQSATVGTAFAGQLQALVKDGGGDAVPNAQVTFTAASNGAGGTFSNGMATYSTTTNSAGIATSLTLTANATAGSYAVTAAVTGVTTAASFSLTNLKAPVLTITESPVGPFVQGQSAVYIVTVGNAAGAGPTSEPVTVTDIVPNGLALMGMSGGPAWNCSVPGSCTTNAVLNPGSTYPSITVTVSVASNWQASVTNQISASGGGSPTATVTGPTAILSACDVSQDGSMTVTDVQKIINEALGMAPAVNDLTGDGVVNVVDLQIVVNAVMGLGCSYYNPA
jgi:hypothetical protein